MFLHQTIAALALKKWPSVHPAEKGWGHILLFVNWFHEIKYISYSCWADINTLWCEMAHEAVVFYYYNILFMLKTNLKHIYYKLKYVILKYIGNQLCHYIHDVQGEKDESCLYDVLTQISLN